MARPNVSKHLFRWSALGYPLTDSLQTPANLDGPGLLNILFRGFQALQKGLRQVRPLSL